MTPQPAPYPPDIAETPANINAKQLVSQNINVDIERFLSGSGIDVGDAPGWRSINSAEANILLGRSGRDRINSPGIEIPYFNIDGQPVLDRGQPFKRVRLIDAAPGMPKYLSRAGSESHLYIPAKFKSIIESWKLVLPEDSGSNKTLIICEGEKKAARLVKSGIAAVALAGIQMWADSKFRNVEKFNADKAGIKAPRLTKKTPVSPDIIRMIKMSGAERVVILFDSDGLAIDPATNGVSNKFKSVGDGRVCLNPDVYWAGKTFAAALMRVIPGISVGLSFAPHAVDSGNGNLGRQGIDDYALSVSENELREFIGKCADNCVSMSPEQIQIESDKIERDKYIAAIQKIQGFIPLGYSSNSESTIYHIWSKYLNVVKSFTDSSLARKSAFYGNFGSEYCDEILGRDFVVQKADEKTGREEIVQRRFDLDIGQRAVVAACQASGRWSPDSSVRGAGVWSDAETGGLVINSADGLNLVRNVGTGEAIDRVRGRHIYESTDRGGWSDTFATHDEISNVMKLIESSWNWSNESDGILLAGWLFAQAYVGALKARPGIMLSGESGSGKSYLEEWLKKFVGMWGVRIEETRGTSLAGVSQLIKRDAVTLFLDEIEPKSGASVEEASRVNRTIDSIRQMLRAAYSRSDDSGSYGAVKGTANQEATAREVRVCAMLAAIAEHDAEQADRNRNLKIRLKRIEVGPDGKPIHRAPSMPVDSLGLKVFRLMWSRWGQFQTALDEIEQMIEHREPRMRLTLAVPIAAVAVATGRGDDKAWMKSAAAAISAEYGGAAANDDAPRDQDRALARLMVAALDVAGVRKSVGDTVAAALAAGLGQRGRGAGGPDADALRLAGLTARRNHDGTVSVFVATGHQGVEALGRQVGVVNLSSLLSSVDGAEKTSRENRVRLGAADKWAGVWVPTGIVVIGAVETEDHCGATVDVAAAQAPY